jgi:hypothetical protein
MTNAETTILYALSTLAQTCAALAAFVGAVGLYRLQALRDRRRNLISAMSDNMGHRAAPDEDVIAEARRHSPDRPALADLIRRVEPIPGLVADSRRSLIVFEAWNLLVILVSLVGFNHVAALAACPWTLRALWPVALGTVGVTGYCVFVWTRE